MNDLIKLNDQISYFPASEDPLSAEVILIKGTTHTFVYDVGRLDEEAAYLNGLQNSVVIISHFHGDHLENIHRISPDRLFVSRQSYKYTHFGDIVTSDIYLTENEKGELICSPEIPAEYTAIAETHTEYSAITKISTEHASIDDVPVNPESFGLLATSPACDRPLIHIFPLPSSHAKGCLGLEVNNSLVFTGDAIYGRQSTDSGEDYNYQLTQQEIKVLEGLHGESLYMGHRLPVCYSRKAVIKFLGSHLVR